MAFQTTRGMRDFLLQTAQKKRFIEETLEDIFKLYSFVPIQTPVVEDLNVLTNKGSGGEEIESEIYSFEDKKGRKLGLRFDMTVPLARIVSSNPSLRKPFKRYTIGTVYRYDRPQAMRYREFTQADADIVGSSDILSDYEIISLSFQAMKRLGVKCKMAINSRNLLEKLALACGVKKNQIVDCFRAIDKLDKIKEKGVKEELKQNKISDKILEKIKLTSIKEIEKELKQLKIKCDDFERLKDLFELTKENSINGFLEFDLSLARGLEYYTGIVFEIKIENGPSIAAGGRYNNLVKNFGGPDTDAIGISFGVDRILDVVGENLITENKTGIFLFAMDKKFKNNIVKLSEELRGKGIGVSVDLMGKPISKNFEYASKEGIPFSGLIGEKEFKTGKITIKDMKSGKQQELKLKDLNRIVKLIKGN